MTSWTMAVALSLAGVGQTGAAGPARIAVVNIPQVSERYQRRIDLEAQFEAKRKELSQKKDELKQKVDQTTRSLQEVLKPGTQAYRDKARELTLQRAELDFFIESESQRIEIELAETLRTIFDDIAAVTRQIAEQRGVDLVLSADTLPQGQAENPTQMRQQIVLQKIIYWRPEIDLTDEVVTRLNDQYKAGAGRK